MDDTVVQDNLMRCRISKDLAVQMEGPSDAKRKATTATFKVIIECNLSFPGGMRNARETLIRAFTQARKPQQSIGNHIPDPEFVGDNEIRRLAGIFDKRDEIYLAKSAWTESYIFARLTRKTIDKLCNWSIGNVMLIYKIWLDHKLERCIYESVRTIKCDAARTSFAAAGKGIVWAVADTGIDGRHPHFQAHRTLELHDGLSHYDFTAEHASQTESADAALLDTDGHGTHVAGIIAGRSTPSANPGGIQSIIVQSNERNLNGTSTSVEKRYADEIAGLAPFCKLVSLKVLESAKEGDLSNLIAAIGYIQRMNDNGRTIRIHGLNLSLGYTFNPIWYAAGQSPLCTEVDRLVRSGVCVVVAAGNAGYGTVTQHSGGVERASHLGTIMDPGNAALAITVGSTHRDRPHSYGVSYFSSKGPTADGRMKPDLVAPGERIISCDSTVAGAPGDARFREDSGTSMATPHVSGAIAAFLSVRAEFQGQPERVKEVFMAGATDLKRRSEFQGAGLIDLMRTLQAV